MRGRGRKKKIFEMKKRTDRKTNRPTYRRRDIQIEGQTDRKKSQTDKQLNEETIGSKTEFIVTQKPI